MPKSNIGALRTRMKYSSSPFTISVALKTSDRTSEILSGALGPLLPEVVSVEAQLHSILFDASNCTYQVTLVRASKHPDRKKAQSPRAFVVM